MSEDPYGVAFGLIATAGNSKGKAFEAIEAAREHRFDDARQLIAESDDEFKGAHKLQFSLLQQEAKNQPVDVNIILVHAQDHLTMAMVARDLAEELVEVYTQIADFKKMLNGNDSKEN